MPTDDILRKQLVALLKGGQAHADIRHVLADFPFEQAGTKPDKLPYSAWQLVEHIRFTLQDLLIFLTDSNYQAPKWPDDYWPEADKPASEDAWRQSVKAVDAALQEFIQLAQDERTNLYDTIPWADDNQNVLREILLAADHTSYHTGELIVLRRLLGNWKS